MDNSLLSACDLEPIHLASAIQEFGVLLVLDASSFKVVQVSANSENLFHLKPTDIIGKSMFELFGEESLQALLTKSKRVLHKKWIANITYSEKVILLEVEPRSESFHTKIESNALDQIQNATSFQTLLDITARAISEITGLDRVMIYRFHEDLHGEVLAETVLTGVESYLGLHYPASDIPLPARAVFLKNWVRTIPDVNYEPVPLQPRDNPVTRAPLDLGVSLLRAVSPTHIEYLKNMRVGASLTISLVVEGKLWGLIACHHLSKKLVSMEIRDACESIGRMASAFISVRVQADSMAERSRFRKIHEVLVANIKNSRDMAAELTQSTPNLLDLISASGSSAALYLDGYWGIVGSTPPEDKLELLVDWLSDTHPEKTVYSTQALAEQFPGAVDFLPQWCGVLAISIPKSKRNYIFWFRPEVKGTVNWAGKLEKSVDAMGRLHPRGSFAVWQQAVEGKSTAWSEIEIETALQLRNEIMASDLREQFQREQDARIEAVRATKAREELMAVLSHDLKNPIGSIRLGAQFATKFLNPESFEKVRTYLSRIERATVSMDSLINDILSITKLEAGFLSIEKEMVGIDELIREVMDLVAPIANDKQIQMVSNFKAATCETVCDRNQMFQVISNILGNAIKFTPEHGKISIVLEECGPEYVKIAVTDSGPGIPPENLANVFDRFWQAQQTKRFGTGLGLTIVKGIVENHGGKVWAESDGKTGTTFHFTLPMIRKVRRS